MFKNALIYRLNSEWSSTIDSAIEALQGGAFLACGASQETSGGWKPPRGLEHGALIESVGGQWLLQYATESKILPSSVVKEKVKEQCDAIEAQTGRKPGKKQKRELMEDTRNALLPMAFTKKSQTNVWIDPQAKLLLIGTGTTKTADPILTSLVKCLEGINITLIATQNSATACMSMWLGNSDEVPGKFSTDRDCLLKAADESKSTVRYAKHPLDIEEIRSHIAAGKSPTQLAMTWNDRVSFVLTEKGNIKKITFLDTVFLDGKNTGDDAFDADAAIATGELSKMIPDLLEALGGEIAYA